MKITATFAGSVVRDALHRKLFYVILALTVILILLVPLLPSAELGVQLDLMREAALGLASIMAFLLAIILGSSMIWGEMERRTVYNTLSKPVRRWQYYFGKFTGLLVVLALTLSLVYVVMLLFVLVYFGIFNPGLAKALSTIFLEASVLAAVAMVFSIYLNPLVSVFLTVLIYVLGHVKGDYLYRVMSDAGNGFALRGLAGVFYYALPNLERLNINETVAHGERVFRVGALELILLAGMALSFTAIAILVGTFIFSRRDL
jgi:Cu-processing system permease protein